MQITQTRSYELYPHTPTPKKIAFVNKFNIKSPMRQIKHILFILLNGVFY